MEISKIEIENPDPILIKKAAEILKKGGLIIYPTDTAYGLGVDALNIKAVRKLYLLKGRDFSKPTHVVVSDWQMIETVCYTNEPAKKLCDKFLPGALTIILLKKKVVPNILTANLPTLGIRIPDNLITQSLSNLLTFPYTTPSANKSGGTTPYSIDEVKKQLDITRVDLILNAGELSKVKPSTIVDLTATPPKILREGEISSLEILNLIKLT